MKKLVMTSDRVDPDGYLEHQMNEQSVRLYMVSGVLRKTQLLRLLQDVRSEISAGLISTLPFKSDQNCQRRTGTIHSFYYGHPLLFRRSGTRAGQTLAETTVQDDVRDKVQVPGSL